MNAALSSIKKARFPKEHLRVPIAMSIKKPSNRSERPTGRHQQMVDLAGFLVIPDILRSLHRTAEEQKSRLAFQQTTLSSLCESTCTMNREIKSTVAQFEVLKEHLAGFQGGMQRLSAVNETLAEQSHRKNTARPLGNSLIDLLVLIERMDLPQADSEMLQEEVRKILTSFSLELFTPQVGDAFEPKTMSAVRQQSINSRVVSETLRPGLIYRSEDGSQTHLCTAEVKLGAITRPLPQSNNPSGVCDAIPPTLEVSDAVPTASAHNAHDNDTPSEMELSDE